MGGGVPIGAFLCNKKADVFKAGEHGSTFGGNPLVCAVAYAVTKYIIEYDVAGNAQRTGTHLGSCLAELKAKHSFIADVRGRGLLWAVEFKKDMAESVMLACIEKGLLVNKLKPNAIRLIPPLIITKKDVDEAVGILGEVLARQSG
jgi:acetylornithine/succinyldiaminopimelate/putrescine aminotransferase